MFDGMYEFCQLSAGGSIGVCMYVCLFVQYIVANFTPGTLSELSYNHVV